MSTKIRVIKKEGVVESLLDKCQESGQKLKDALQEAQEEMQEMRAEIQQLQFERIQLTKRAEKAEQEVKRLTMLMEDMERCYSSDE